MHIVIHIHRLTPIPTHTIIQQAGHRPQTESRAWEMLELVRR